MDWRQFHGKIVVSYKDGLTSVSGEGKIGVSYKDGLASFSGENGREL
jgi:hypothetical protein